MWGQHGWHSTLGAWAWPCGALSKCFRVSLDSLPQGQPTKQERSSSTSFSLLSEGSLPNLLFLPFYWFIYLPTLSIKHAHNIYWMVTLLSTLRAFLSLIFSITLRQTQPGHSLRIKQLAAGIDFMRGSLHERICSERADLCSCSVILTLLFISVFCEPKVPQET